MTDLTKPLAEVPVGAHVVHDGEAWEVWHTGPFGVGLAHLTGRRPQKPGPNFGPDEAADTRVLHLDGNAPRPLAKCVGRDVWSPSHGVLTGVYQFGPDVWMAANVWGLESGADGDTPVWPIVPPQPAADHPQSLAHVLWTYRDVPGGIWEVTDGRVAFDCPNEAYAVALAEFLQREQWQPPEPEPERPTLQDAADWLTDLMVKDDHEDTLRWLLVDHAVGRGGTVNVDVQALSEAVQWLRVWATSTIPSPAKASATDLLDALGVDRG